MICEVFKGSGHRVILEESKRNEAKDTIETIKRY